MSECAERYAVALAMPLTAGASGACIPSVPNFPSQKETFRAVVPFAIGSAGIGFCAVNPLSGFINNASGGGNPFVTCTDATYSSAVIAFGGAGLNNYDSTSPYVGFTSTTCPDGVECRVVGGGINAWYVGDANVKGGTAVTVQQPNHKTLATESYATLAPQPWASVQPVIGNDSHIVTYTPANAVEVDFDSSLAGGGHNNYMAILVQGEPGRKFTAEVVFHYEWRGSGATRLSPNIADPVGFSSVLTVAQSAAASGTGFALKRGDTNGAARRIARFLKGTVHAITHAMSGLPKALASSIPDLNRFALSKGAEWAAKLAAQSGEQILKVAPLALPAIMAAV